MASARDAWAATGASQQPAERRLAELASAVGPLRRVLAALAGRLVATRAYERLCYARLGDYARERLGRSARQLQDLAHVHRALAEIPAVEHALVANVLPWSKVRLLARVATQEDQVQWVARARAVSTRSLEREVRAAGRVAELPPQRRISLCCTPEVRERWSLAHEMAERVAGQRLCAGEALELVAAEVFSDLSMAADADRAPEASATSTRDAVQSAPERKRLPTPRLPPRNLAPVVVALQEGLEDADPFELDRRLRLAVRMEQTLDAAMAPLLRRVTAAEHEWSGRFQTLGTYAREQLGMSARKARALLRLERAGDVCPELRAAYRHGRLSWVQAQCLVPLLCLDIPGGWRRAWVAWAERVSVRRLEADVARALLLRAGHHAAWQRCKRHPERAQDAIPAGERQMCAPDVDLDATECLTWRVPPDVALLYAGVRESVRARLRASGAGAASEGEVFAEMLGRALRAWTLRDPASRRPDLVVVRDGYRCAVPGCMSRRNLQDHHIRFRSAGGSNEEGNRITLCAFHHLRCLHTGRLRVRGRAPQGLVFVLGRRPGGPPLARYRSGDILLRGA